MRVGTLEDPKEDEKDQAEVFCLPMYKYTSLGILDFVSHHLDWKLSSFTAEMY